MTPCILILMVDQLAGTLFPDGPAPWLHTPHLRALAARSARYAACYTASPLCAPARASFMTGQLPSRTGVYDNAAELPSAIPTFAHHLRRAGYRTALSGKMHFVGPDQLHGFERRLTTDIYPADFGWTPDYRRPGERIDWWYHNLGSVSGAGVAEITNQMDYDDEVAFHAEQALYDFARGGDPWCLCVSFTHPHDPYVARRAFWDLYADCAHLDPAQPAPAMDPHAQRLRGACDAAQYALTPAQVRAARRAYFANISYVDAKIGQLLDVCARCGMDPVVVFTADHGDMLGERDLWFKMNFYEPSARVPLMLAGAGVAPGRVATPVSTLDIAPTLALIGAAQAADLDMDGADLRRAAPRPIPMEYAAEGSVAPMVALRHGPWKLIRCAADPDLAFNLDDDPGETRDRAGDPALAPLAAAMAARWDLAAFDAQVRTSQRRRLIVYEALRNGAYYPWDFQPLARASERYMRNHMDLNVLEQARRHPQGG